MVNLTIRLTGKAEDEFRELLARTGADGYEIIADAIALFYHAVDETISGKKIAIYDSKTREAQIISSPILSRLG